MTPYDDGWDRSSGPLIHPSILGIIGKNEQGKKEETASMLRWVTIFALPAILFSFCFGCSWTAERTSKGLAIRCPKCAAFYSSEEGADTFEWMRGNLKETRR